MTDSPRFIHLRTHSEYSLLEGAMRLKKLPDIVRGAGMPAIALTDTNNMFAALEFSVGMAGAGVQPIIGCQVDLQYVAPRPGERPRPPAPLVLLAQSEAGYENLMKLNSCLYLREGSELPHVTLEELAGHASDVICLTGGPEGPVGMLLQGAQRPAAEALIDSLSAAFGDRLYVELQRHPGEGGAPEAEVLTERGFVEMAYARDIPLVATNDVYFPKTDMYESHDALICIADGAYVDQQEPRRRLTAQHYFKSQAEMVTLFADLPEAIENTVEIARRCAFMAYRRDPILPKFADDEVEELRKQANAGLVERLKVIPHAASVEEYQKRLDFELDIIEGMGFPGYFLIVADFIKWAKDHNIPVGPGRGSGAGSLVAYALTVTDLDPLRYALLFERFLNPERVSMPDFDIDFCMDRREEVIRYVQEKYGRDKVGQIITFGALLSKAAVRDIGRVLQMPYGQVDRLSKLIPVEGVKPVSIEKALADEPRLREEARNEEVVARLLEYGQQVEGLLRNASTHAAGVVIGDRPLDALVPLYQDPRSDMPATQFNMKWVEQAGLVKFDFLGLKTLTVIQNAVEQILASGRPLQVAADGTELYTPAHGMENDIGGIPLDDEASYKLYASAKTVAVFQVESSGMMDALKRMKPDCIEDIIALVALYRPGPMENIPKFCEVKNKLSERDLLHPTIDHILDETQGIIVYQEQVMQIAQVLSGYSLGEADLLRRAMGKKIAAEMEVQRARFVDGAVERGVNKAQAGSIFDLVAKFANYGFNKSHAAAYALVSYHTAWLKANHPVEFMAASMTLDMGNTEKLGDFRQEARRMGIEIVPPSINRSMVEFDVQDGKVVYAMGAIKGVGEQAVEHIVEVRSQGAFKSLGDFARRISPKQLNKRTLENLLAAGAFDELEPNRARVLEGLDRIMGLAQRTEENKTLGQDELFGGSDSEEPLQLPDVAGWTPDVRLQREHAAIGFYLSAHPLDEYDELLEKMRVQPWAKFAEAVKKGASAGRLAGTVISKQERKTKTGNKMGIVRFSDGTGQFEGLLFKEKLEQFRDALEPGRSMVILVGADMRDDEPSIRIEQVDPIEKVAARVQKSMRVFLRDDRPIQSLVRHLNVRGEGDVTVVVLLENGAREVEVKLPGRFRLSPEIAGALKAVPGVTDVQMA
ncbi:MAG: DNA polymerase III subunit alpha [Tateyamaria sp.]|uniref:DNA polymerase III subunit alpha n=1 Tax=Tateyamaria sp. TaxID=1929288 RepID=UPI003287391C